MKFGNVRELAISQEARDNEARNKQYALAGAYIVQRADQLIAVYDGKPAAGTGGTGQIVDWYCNGQIEPEYRYANHFFLPPRQNPVIVIDTER